MGIRGLGSIVRPLGTEIALKRRMTRRGLVPQKTVFSPWMERTSIHIQEYYYKTGLHGEGK